MGSKFGFRYEETPPDKCIDVPCLHYVFTNNHWMHLPLRAPALAAFGERLGLRSWFAAGEVEIQNGQVIGKIYGIQFYSGSDYPDINISAWHEHKLQIDRCSYYPLKRHPGYGFRNASNIRSFTALVSDDASQENRDHAFQFNLKCLTRRTKCKDFSELIPAAWADFEEDNRWSMTHEDNLVWQIGKPCPF
jgi:hypothetical protein